MRKGERIIRLGDFCKIAIVPAKETGVSMSNGKRAVTLAVIKQADENMDDMKQAIIGTMNYFRKVYPDIEFSISRNQTELWTIQYLTCNRIFHWAFFYLYCCCSFLGDIKSPFIIGLSMTVSIVICFLFSICSRCRLILSPCQDLFGTGYDD